MIAKSCRKLLVMVTLFFRDEEEEKEKRFHTPVVVTFPSLNIPVVVINHSCMHHSVISHIVCTIIVLYVVQVPILTVLCCFYSERLFWTQKTSLCSANRTLILSVLHCSCCVNIMLDCLVWSVCCGHDRPMLGNISTCEWDCPLRSLPSWGMGWHRKDFSHGQGKSWKGTNFLHDKDWSHLSVCGGKKEIICWCL